MLKNDVEMLVTACFAALLLALASFESISKNLGLSLEGIRESEEYKAFSNYKTSEAAFWANLKGTKVTGGEVSDILNNASEMTSNTVNQTAPKTPADTKITPPVKFLLVGDSMMLVGFGPALENKLLKFTDVSVVREGAYSTGLNRIDYFDWFTKTDELIAQHKPDVLIVMFGANDGQGIVDKNKKSHEFGSEGWSEVYRQRTNVYLSRVSPKVKRIYWIGHPIPGENFMQKFSTMNPIYQTEIAKFPNADYIDTWERFAVNGKYSQSIPDDSGLRQIAKQSDGVHVTDFGGEILTNLVIKIMSEKIELK